MATQKVKKLYERYMEEPTKLGSAAILLRRFPELQAPSPEPQPVKKEVKKNAKSKG